MTGDAAALRAAVDAGLDHLVRTQRPSGEFPSFATPLGGELEWAEDSSVFVTSLSVLALAAIDDGRVRSMTAAALGLLRAEAAPGPLWRFWTHDHDRHREIPCDADDTACATMALEAAGADGARSRRLLLGNRDDAGRFYTWFLPRGPGALAPGRFRNTVDEWRARGRRVDFWSMTEASPGDVDGVVNANVLRLFGPDAPPEPVALLTSVVAEGRERTCDAWYRNEFACWYSVAQGMARGVPYPGEVGATVVARIADRAAGGIEHDLDAAHALGALQALSDAGHEAPAATVTALVGRLLDTPGDDGAWDRSIFFHGGPTEVFAWGSEAYTTAVAVAGLDRHLRTVG